MKLILLLIITKIATLSNVAALDSQTTTPFELRKFSSLSVSQLWNTPARHSVFEDKGVVIRLTAFHQGARAKLGFEKVPVVMLLLGRKRSDYDPNGYILFTDHDSSFSLTTETPSQNEDGVFRFIIKEVQCDQCREGRFSIIDDEQQFDFESTNIILELDN